MSKTIPLARNHSAQKLKVALKTSRDEGQKTKLRVILSVKKGKLRKEIAEDLNLNIDTVTDTVKKYNTEGIDGLKTNKGGRPEGNPKWDTSIFDALIKEIDKQDRYWSIPIMMRWVKENQKKEIPYNTVWYHVRNLDYSYKSARPHPYLGNKEKQEAF